MRSGIALCCIVSIAIVGCAKRGEDAEKGADAQGSTKIEAEAKPGSSAAAAPAKVSLPEPRIGGTVAVVGDATVEVVVHRAGLVEARVYDASGADLSSQAKLGITASTRSGGREAISLAFAPAHACLEGNASAGVELASGPLDLALELAGKKAEARLDLAVALEPPRFGGHVVALGDHAAELVTKGDAFHAFVFDASGNAVTNADLDLKLHAETRSAAGLELKWDPPSASYVVRAGADLSAKPIFVTLTQSRKTMVAGLASLRAALELTAERAASLNANAAAKVAADATVKAPAVGAKVAVEAPRVAADAAAKGGASAKAAAGAAAAAKVQITPPKIQVRAPTVDIDVKKSVSAGTKAGGSAKASAGFGMGTK